MKKKIFSLILILILPVIFLCGCDYTDTKTNTKQDIQNTQNVVNELVNN